MCSLARPVPPLALMPLGGCLDAFPTITLPPPENSRTFRERIDTPVRRFSNMHQNFLANRSPTGIVAMLAAFSV